jgi:hypothetical protein
MDHAKTKDGRNVLTILGFVVTFAVVGGANAFSQPVAAQARCIQTNMSLPDEQTAGKIQQGFTSTGSMPSIA